MTEEARQPILKRALSRLSHHPEFLAWIFAELGRLEGVDDSTLAARFQISEDRLVEFLLCPKPRAEEFARDLDDLVAAFGIDGAALASAIRKLDALTNMQGGVPVGFLMAARPRRE